ncbi:hypothetical protein Ddye_001515 [Dipteronia dyeriana]|uniref:Reverse transcriptase domain-containing protein n=1 Tax=Dipteronia dyeriana TaxID=168575 RepID=A0AAD9XNK1_9ROSI|nr:hypothetical protein Ddye_001515 [Dipteronia dyeriana]
MEKEEIYWHQRSRENWLKSGDKNSRYFHSQASYRKAQNYIIGLYNEHGDWVDSKEGFFGVIQDYFSNVFCSASSSTQDISRVLEYVQPCLASSKSSFLDSNFSDEEIRRAIFDMAPTKAPGPDGLSTLFNQKLWPIMGSNVTKTCLMVLNEGHDITLANRTLITLIPKVKKMEKMSDFHPISLCNVLCKIIVKALTTRLRGVLGDVISEKQSAFIPGRLISNNTMWVSSACMG